MFSNEGNITILDPLIMSPSIMYELDVADGLTCSDQYCAYKKYLSIAKGHCSFKFLCSDLDDHICGDYGITVHQGGQHANTSVSNSVCSVGQIVSQEMQVGDSISLEMWKTSTTKKSRFSCHFWCTSSGGLPKSKEDLALSYLNEKKKSQFVQVVSIAFVISIPLVVSFKDANDLIFFRPFKTKNTCRQFQEKKNK